ncbi:MAG: hypothetical protein A3D44_01555 [Candidatus Staskawiczbacteria bacterium RIFCSPHIGHO2_02_FULL_42_22]|uniref:Metallo-beta-lactamase domain-containing protein n=1 Tax=Candidatus Staskawiczbacteria bacterium RIFCSPHIGHO2_02_FULL_42_22 TaxID=1802207 RepID=A0A1G2HZP0_9BACT|nr:MAG: hypothetical protein A3D44_01555 [Candidatus Staskawiczbacteria bacterium RIFCSPHIGHO2_02_FULL_42_22]
MENFFTTRQKICLGAITVLLLLNIFIWQQVWILALPRHLKVRVLDIGQGDSIFIETPSMRHIIIDGGVDAMVMSKLHKLLPFWQRHLDVVMLTHPDADHLNGLLYVLKKYKVDYIIWNGVVRGGEQYQVWLTLLEKAKKQGTKIIITKAGDQIKNDKVAIETLHPFINIEGRDARPKNEDNDTGIVSRLTYGKNSFLFTADVSSVVEEALVKGEATLTSDVLKVAHHGSRFSTSENFLEAVHPDLAVISVGAKNTYGHPAIEVLQRLQNFGITTLRTDEQGTVEILSDGENIKVIK